MDSTSMASFNKTIRIIDGRPTVGIFNGMYAILDPIGPILKQGHVAHIEIPEERVRFPCAEPFEATVDGVSTYIVNIHRHFDMLMKRGIYVMPSLASYDIHQISFTSNLGSSTP